MPFGPTAVRVNAVLSAFKDNENSDVIDALCYFFIPILDRNRGKPVTSSFLTKAAKLIYGWDITESVGDVFLERLTAHGILKTERKHEHIQYIAQASPNLPSNIDNSISDAFDEVTSLFSDFELISGDLIYRKLSPEDLGDLLVRFLISLGAYTNESIAAELKSNARENKEYKALKALKNDISVLNQSETHVCARFVQWLHNENPSMAENLSHFVAAGLLAELVEDFRKPSTVKTSSETTFFLDGPMLLGLVGTSGHALQEEAKTIVDALKSIGCQVQVFSEGCREAERVLSAYLKAQSFQRHGRTHTAVLNSEISREFVKTVLLDVERAAKKFGIDVRDYRLDSFPNQHKYFNSNQNTDIYSYLAWENLPAREHDAFAVTAIMRLRGGKHKNDPLQNSYVFISSNQSLVRKARDYCIESQLIGETQCGPVVDTRDLATIAWLRTGFENSEKIPISHMLAQCERVLRVRLDVIDAASKNIAKFSPEKQEQFELLLQDNRAVNYLMDTARGSTAVFDPDREQELLDGMLEAAIKIVTDDTDRKISEKDRKIRKIQAENRKSEFGLRKKHDSNILEQKQKNAAVAAKLKDLETLREKDKQELKEISLRNEQIMKAGIQRTNRIISLIQSFVGLVLFGSGIAASVGVLSNGPLPEIAGYALKFFSLIGLGLTIQAIRGRSVPGLMHFTERFGKYRFMQYCHNKGVPKNTVEERLAVCQGRVILASDESISLQ